MLLFCVAAGVQIGIGHVKRSVQLAVDLHERKQQVLLCLEYDSASIEIIKKSNLNFSIISAENTITDIIKNNPAIRLIVLDLIHVSQRDTQKIKQEYPGMKILALDYFDMQDSNVDTVINLHNHNKEYDKPVNPSVKYLEGPAYGILRNEFNPFISNENSEQKKTLKNILITFGGSDPKQHTLTIIPILDEIIHGLSLHVIIITGPNFTHKNEIMKALEHVGSDFETIHNPSNMPQLMKDADLCICGSGTTILELSALGTPALVAPQSKEELAFSKRFETAGFAKIIGTMESIDKAKVEAAIKNYYNNPSELAAAGIIGTQLCDGKGKERIVNELITLIS